eukprot:CAMPEP_0176088388 /NCGR_PEP_ID=MMETSP0120_2-20121206/44256_1 /TAXON_ID=160619 /ORGANISM="Kryptoperidinium foliaceum, Strain CCMP 1326" /LENGTH=538 /DNA_ID=CAMNT_0017422245 /DNA_START=48 /DNA_END=1660 /DNA_ORIENTATION=-
MVQSLAKQLFALVLVALVAMQCLSGLAQFACWCRKWLGEWRSIQDVWRELGICKGTSPDEGFTGKFVASEMARRSTRRAQFIISVSSKFACLMSFGIISNSINEEPRWMTFQQDIIHLLNFVFVWTGTCVPSLIRPRTLNLWYVALSLEMLAFCAWSDDDMFLYACLSGYVQRLIYALLPTSVVVVAGCNGIQVVVLGSIYSARGATHGALGRGFDVPGFLVLEMFCSIACIAFSWLLRASASAELERHAKTHSLQGENSAAQRLLALMCHVVVELDQELCLTDNVPKFSAMFTMSTRRDLRGRKLQDFLSADEERERFAALLEGASLASDDPRASCATGAMLAAMRAGGDTKVQVELFFVRYEHFDGSPRFLVGIHEVADQPISDLRHFRSAPRRPPPVPPPTMGTPSASSAEPLAKNALAPAAATLATLQEEKEDEEGMQITCEHAVDATMLMTLLSWRVHSKESCCYLHALLKEGRACLQRLGRGGCRRELEPNHDAQCTECGIMAHWRGETHARGSALACQVCDAVALRRAQTS